MDVLYKEAGPQANYLWWQFVFGRPSTGCEAKRVWAGLSSHPCHHSSFSFELGIITVVVLAIPHLDQLVKFVLSQMLDCHYPQTKASRG